MLNTQSSTTGYAAGLKTRISDLESDKIFIQNELIDTLKPSIMLTDFTFIVSELLAQNIAFVKKNGMTESARVSRKKLLYLLEAGEWFNKVTMDNNTLQILNKAILGENQILQKQLSEIKRQEAMPV